MNTFYLSEIFDPEYPANSAVVVYMYGPSPSWSVLIIPGLE